MSGADDHFLARWSRRKQAARQAPAVEEPDETSVPAPTTERPAMPADPAPANEAAASEITASEDLTSLPRIEDLSADSDISAFLRKEVPAALRTAALRRAWSLDPEIRDFVGLSENAWNFNDPDSIPGFGSPASLGDAAVRFLERTSGSGTPPEPEGPAAAPGAGALPGSEAPVAAGDAAANPDPVSVRPPTGPARRPLPAEAAGPDRSDTPAASDTPIPAPPRHGGATPR